MSDFLKSVGNEIRKIRTEQRLTLEELAEKTDLNLSYLGKIERGEKNVTLLTLEKIIKTLNISPSILFDFTINNQNDTHSLNNLLERHKRVLRTREVEEVETIHRIIVDIISLIDINHK